METEIAWGATRIVVHIVCGLNGDQKSLHDLFITAHYHLLFDFTIFFSSALPLCLLFLEKSALSCSHTLHKFAKKKTCKDFSRLMHAYMLRKTLMN